MDKKLNVLTIVSGSDVCKCQKIPVLFEVRQFLTRKNVRLFTVK